MKMIVVALSLVSAQAFAVTTLTVNQDLASADLKGPHSTIAKNVIGLHEGKVLPEYQVTGKGCTLKLAFGRVARLAKGEKLTMVSETVTMGYKENCTKYQQTPGGDGYCIGYGKPIPSLYLNAKLMRGAYEVVDLLCIGTGKTKRTDVDAQLLSSLGTLITVTH